MFMKKNVILSIIIIFVFLIIYYFTDILKYFGIVIEDNSTRLFTFRSVALILSFITTGLLFGTKNILRQLGMGQGFARGIGYGFIFTLPMLLGFAMIGEPINDWSLMFIVTVFFGAAMEEIVFRGFLFGLLFRNARWGFIPAVVFNALFFGIAHLYQGNSWDETLGVFLVTLIGAIWFAWLYIEWDYNIWIAVALHFFMNLFWKFFEVDSTALGGWGVNLFRILTIIFSIVFTIQYRQRKGIFLVNRSNLIYHK